MRLSEIMSSPVATIEPSEPIEIAVTRMGVENVRHLVVMYRGDVVGVLSSHDVEGGAGLTVAERMSRKPVVADSKMTVREAANKLRGRNVGCLPIVDGGELIGIVTISDLLELLGRGAMRPSPRSERATLARRGPTHTTEKQR